jgi:tetratricopeptide (TPR) repeat protein
MKFFLRFLTIITLVTLLVAETKAQTRTTDMQLGTEYFRNREFEKALTIFEKLHEENPSQVTYHYYYSCLIELKNFQKSRAGHAQTNQGKPRQPAL